jgi:hypothetical protein
MLSTAGLANFSGSRVPHSFASCANEWEVPHCCHFEFDILILTNKPSPDLSAAPRFLRKIRHLLDWPGERGFL